VVATVTTTAAICVLKRLGEHDTLDAVNAIGERVATLTIAVTIYTLVETMSSTRLSTRSSFCCDAFVASISERRSVSFDGDDPHVDLGFGSALCAVRGNS